MSTDPRTNVKPASDKPASKKTAGRVDKEHIGEIELLECSNCSRLTVGMTMRCSACGSTRLLPTWRPGTGVVAAATTTEVASFAMIDIESGVRVLAIGPPSLRPQIDDIVTLSQDSDGTFSLCARERGVRE